MSAKKLHNIAWVPIALIGLGSVGLGLAWFLSPEPWILDKTANEDLLQTSFQKLFSAPINQHLPDYLTLSYRFFGWWVFSIGLLVLAYTFVTRLGTRLSRNVIHTILFLILAGILRIELTFIPRSPFVILSAGLWILWAVSVWASVQLRRLN